MNDLRYALRSLFRRPGFTIVAVLTLALGLGATTATYTVVDRVVLRPLPYPHPERLVRVWHWNPRSVVPRESMAFETYQELAGSVRSLESVAGVSPHWSFTVSAPDPERVTGYWVAASFFELLGATAALGRLFDQPEDAPGAERVVVISHGFWQERFGSDQRVIGRSISISGVPSTVIGVMRPGFRYAEAVDIWAPLGQNPIVGRGRQVRWVDVVGRLAPGASLEQARGEVGAFMAQVAQDYPAQAGTLGGDVASLYNATLGDVRSALWILLAGVACLLLIACVNVGNLLLARATARRGEVMIRRALGAGRMRLLRQFLTESATLAVLGGLVGLGMATWLVELLRTLGPADLPRFHEVGLDGRVLIVSAVVMLGTGLLFGLAPALSATGENLHGSLKESARSVGGTGRRLREGLVMAQTALATILLAGSALLVKSFVNLMQVDAGFQPERVLTFQLAIPGRYDANGRAALLERLNQDLETLPGVEAVGSTSRLPLGSQLSTRLEVRGRVVADEDQPEVESRRVGGRYFEAMGIPMLRGRGFQAPDTVGGAGSVVLSRGLAAQLWPGQDPLGKQVRFWYAGIPPEAPWLDVVGVVADVKHFGLDAPAPSIAYFAASQGPPSNPLFAVRADQPIALAAAARDRIRGIDPEIVLHDLRTMGARVDASVAPRRFSMLLLGSFGGVSLVLAGVGLYAVIAYAVRQRTHELGIRLALGAAERDVLRLVVGGGIRLAGAGLAAGLVGAALLTGLMRRMLFALSPRDPMTFVTVVVILAVVAALASYLPARRAARTDPMEALRHE